MVAFEAYALDKRIAVVTGAGSGIGRATARVLADAGARVVCADVDGSAAERVAAEIDGVPAHVDVARREQIVGLVEGTAARFGRLDILCNIAGIIRTGLVVDVPEEDLDAVWAVNFKGTFHACQAAARIMCAQGSGAIVNTASGAVDSATPEIMSYSVSKAAVVQLTKNLAAEVGRFGVRVNAVAPGLVRTAMTARHYLLPDGSIDEAARAAAEKPLKRLSPLGMIGEPEDIAHAVHYLVSDAARFVTGQILRPNGGVAMPW
ncbi:SDR family NAD(P)-dependent oxidoreductase [Streptacidiphilus neutrinimicus]|uniref:SDR family NAD(P)-dependent oxidoreductase n=1 Tax=Streptacidiphilus neutrinimicus TaxID=105420 RepID=UPI0005A78545|nr:SDR family NAD(P)-dependent oxidoreductase [Streptacidiphilus neutrinimicus]